MSNVRIPKENPQKYTDEQLLEAMRRTARDSRYQRLSESIYKDERQSHYPNPVTIKKQLGSWPAALELAGLETARDGSIPRKPGDMEEIDAS